jgi:hypothetical protein
VVRHFAFGLVAGFSRRSRFASGICSGLARMIAAMRSFNSSTVFDWALLLHSLL